jgi:outer membrane immunogenic protein
LPGLGDFANLRGSTLTLHARMKPTPTIFLLGAMFCAVILAFAATSYAGPERINPKEPIVELNPPERFDWSGLYIGGNIGGSWTNYTFSRFTDGFDLNTFDNELDDETDTEFYFQSFTFPNFSQEQGLGDLGSNDSLTGGGQIGYQHQFGHFVVGVEGDFNRTATNAWQTFTDHRVIPQVPFNNEQANIDFTAMRKAETEWMASARAKVGYARGPVMIYVTGGVAFADVNVWAIDTGTVDFLAFSGPLGEDAVGGTNRNVARADDIQVGYTVGGGIEWAANNMFSIGIEGRHSDFGSHTYTFSSNGTLEFPGRTRIDLESDMVVVKFNLLLCNFFRGH